MARTPIAGMSTNAVSKVPTMLPAGEVGARRGRVGTPRRPQRQGEDARARPAVRGEAAEVVAEAQGGEEDADQAPPNVHRTAEVRREDTAGDDLQRHEHGHGFEQPK